MRAEIISVAYSVASILNLEIRKAGYTERSQEFINSVDREEGVVAALKIKHPHHQIRGALLDIGHENTSSADSHGFCRTAYRRINSNLREVFEN